MCWIGIMVCYKQQSEVEINNTDIWIQHILSSYSSFSQVNRFIIMIYSLQMFTNKWHMDYMCMWSICQFLQYQVLRNQKVTTIEEYKEIGSSQKLSIPEIWWVQWLLAEYQTQNFETDWLSFSLEYILQTVKM